MAAHVAMRSRDVDGRTLYETPCEIEVDDLGGDVLCEVCLGWLPGRRDEFIRALEDPRWVVAVAERRKRAAEREWKRYQPAEPRSLPALAEKPSVARPGRGYLDRPAKQHLPAMSVDKRYVPTAPFAVDQMGVHGWRESGREVRPVFSWLTRLERIPA